MADVLMRRGDLVLVRVVGRLGLFRQEACGAFRPAGTLDPDEWRWTLTCAAPVALFAGGTEAAESEPLSAGPLTEVRGA